MADAKWTRVGTGVDSDSVRSLVSRWPESGETQRRYCDRHGIALSTFSYWRSRIAREKVVGASTTGDAGRSIVPFREVVITDAPERPTVEPRAGWSAEVELPNGAIVRIRNEADAQTITMILRAVTDAC